MTVVQLYEELKDLLMSGKVTYHTELKIESYDLGRLVSEPLAGLRLFWVEDPVSPGSSHPAPYIVLEVSK